MMKSKYIFILAAAAILLFSCRDDDVDTPHFEVSVDKTEYKAGDSIVFTFDGDPDIITFYSGESGHEYRYKDRTFAEGAQVKLDFVSRVLYGSQVDNLTIKVSSDFSGIYDVENVKNATWTDITSRFTLPRENAPGYAYSWDTPSGTADLTDLTDPAKPFYFAFKYYGWPSTPTTQRTWRITAFNMTAVFENGAVSTLANLTSAAWSQVDVANPANKWALPGTQLQLAPASATDESEDWAITKPLYPTRVAPDLGVPIKNYSQRLSQYGYKFAASGEYTVTFVAKNATSEGEQSVVREVKITITD